MVTYLGSKGLETKHTQTEAGFTYLFFVIFLELRCGKKVGLRLRPEFELQLHHFLAV